MTRHSAVTYKTSKNIVLFGANGQLGRKLQSLLAARGPVLAYDRARIDLNDLAALRQCVNEARPGLIVNAAAYTAVDAAEKEPERARLVNAEAPRVMAECAREHGALLVHYSTDYVFDGTVNAPYTEDSPTRPLGVYGVTKLAGEEAVANSGSHYLTLRTAWLYSNLGKNFLNTMLRLASERPELRVVDDQIGSPTYSDLLAEATLQMLDGIYANGVIRREHCGLYHVTCAGATSWWGFAQRIIQLAGYADRVRVTPISTPEYPTPARRPAYSVLSNDKLEKTFGIRLPDWQQGLRRCLAERGTGE